MSALLAEDSGIAEFVRYSPLQFFIGETALVELFEHKEKIARFSRLEPAALSQALHRLLRKLSIYKEDFIAQTLGSGA